LIATMRRKPSNGYAICRQQYSRLFELRKLESILLGVRDNDEKREDEIPFEIYIAYFTTIDHNMAYYSMCEHTPIFRRP
jgi:hypothetical protein